MYYLFLIFLVGIFILNLHGYVFIIHKQKKWNKFTCKSLDPDKERLLVNTCAFVFFFYIVNLFCITESWFYWSY